MSHDNSLGREGSVVLRPVGSTSELAARRKELLRAHDRRPLAARTREVGSTPHHFADARADVEQEEVVPDD